MAAPRLLWTARMLRYWLPIQLHGLRCRTLMHTKTICLLVRIIQLSLQNGHFAMFSEFIQIRNVFDVNFNLGKEK